MEIKILIVDDEEIIRDGISKKIQRVMPEASVVGKAQDANEGLEVIKSCNPNIIIVDICMPEIDGLEFISMAKEINKNLKFIIVSGYDNFEYARRGIRLGVEDYLLKPLENEQLKSVLEKLKNKLEEEQNQYSILSELKSKANYSTEFLKNKYLTDLIYYSNEFDVSNILNKLNILKVSFSKPCFTVITIVVSSIDESSPFSEKKDLPLAKFALKNMSEEILSPLGYIVSFENLKYDKQVVLIVNHEEESRSNKSFNLARLCNQLINSIKKYLKVYVAIGIGKSYSDISQVSMSYRESYTAAMQKIILGENVVISYSDIPNTGSIDFYLSNEKKLLLENYMKEGNTDKVLKIINSIFNTIKQKSLSYENIKILYIDLLLLFSKTVKEAGGSWNKIFSEDIFSESYLSRYSSLEQLSGWIKDCVSSICEYISCLKKSYGRKVIDEIKEYINNYYYTEINLNDLSNRYYLNPNYLSQLFKNEVGENFVEYLTKIRVERAKELLLNTDLKSYKIAEMVGYTNHRYFSNVFCKYIGTTPTKFREQKK